MDFIKSITKNKTERMSSIVTEDGIEKNTKIYNEKIAAGALHTLCVMSDGTVKATGDTRLRQCDIGTWRDIISVSTKTYQSVGLRRDGKVEIAGSFSAGYGDPNLYEVNNWNDIIAIASGLDFIVGLKNDGKVVVAGNDHDGCCQVQTWNDIIAIAAGADYIIGLQRNGCIIGSGKRIDSFNCADWSYIKAIASGNTHIVGLRENGTVIAAGRNIYGENNVQEWRDIISIAACQTNTVGIRKDGKVLVAGYNSSILNQNLSNYNDIVGVSVGCKRENMATFLTRVVAVRENGNIISIGDDSVGEGNVGTWNIF